MTCSCRTIDRKELGVRIWIGPVSTLLAKLTADLFDCINTTTTTITALMKTHL